MEFFEGFEGAFHGISGGFRRSFRESKGGFLIGFNALQGYSGYYRGISGFSDQFRGKNSNKKVRITIIY